MYCRDRTCLWDSANGATRTPPGFPRLVGSLGLRAPSVTRCCVFIALSTESPEPTLSENLYASVWLSQALRLFIHLHIPPVLPTDFEKGVSDLPQRTVSDGMHQLGEHILVISCCMLQARERSITVILMLLFEGSQPL